jgi:hypothetical protein
MKRKLSYLVLLGEILAISFLHAAKYKQQNAGEPVKEYSTLANLKDQIVIHYR